MLYKSDSPPPELYNSPPPAFTSLPQDYTGNSYNGAKPLPKIPPSTTGSSVYSDTKSLPQYQTQPILPLQSQITPNRRGTNAPPTNLENQAVQPQMLGYSAPSVPRGVRSQEFHTQAKPPSEEPLRPQRPLSMVSDVDSAAGSHAHGYNPFTGGVQYEQRSFAAAGSAVGYTPGSAPAPAYNSLAHARSQNNLNGSPPPGQPSIQQQFAQQPNFGNQGYPNYSAQRQHNVAAPPSAYASNVINVQPQAGPAMVVAPGGEKGMGGGNRNAKNLPIGVYGRDWSYPLYDCCGDCGTCLVATACPCIIYTKNKQRLDYLAQRGIPDPVQGNDCCTTDCMMHALLSMTCGLGCVLQVPIRRSIRMRYTIEGGGCQDFFAAWCCGPCQLTQESRELALEERSFSQGRGR